MVFSRSMPYSPPSLCELWRASFARSVALRLFLLAQKKSTYGIPYGLLYCKLGFVRYFVNCLFKLYSSCVNLTCVQNSFLFTQQKKRLHIVYYAWSRLCKLYSSMTIILFAPELFVHFQTLFRLTLSAFPILSMRF